MNITVAGIGYVGLANAILLAQNNEVTAVDVVQSKVDKINATLPAFEQIAKIVIRDTDFIRTPAMKIARNLNGNVKK